MAVAWAVVSLLLVLVGRPALGAAQHPDAGAGAPAAGHSLPDPLSHPHRRGLLATVSSAAITSTAPNGTYKIGDVIEVTLTMSETITDVTGSPTVTLVVGSTNVTAAYSSHSGTAVVFEYTVQAFDLDADGVEVTANSLTLPGGASTTPTLTDLTHAGVAASLSHLVDGRGTMANDTNFKVVAKAGTMMVDGSIVAAGSEPVIIDTEANLANNSDAAIPVLRAGDAFASRIQVVSTVATGSLDFAVTCSGITDLAMALAGATVASGGDDLLTVSGTVPAPAQTGAYVIVACSVSSFANAGTTPLIESGTTEIRLGTTFFFRVLHLKAATVVGLDANFKVVAETTSKLADGKYGDGTTAIHDSEANITNRTLAGAPGKIPLLKEGDSLADIFKVKATAAVGGTTGFNVVKFRCEPLLGTGTTLTTFGQMSASGSVAADGTLMSPSGTATAPQTPGLVTVRCHFLEVPTAGSPALTRAPGSNVEPGDVILFKVAHIQSTAELAASTANFKVIAKQAAWTGSAATLGALMETGAPADGVTAIHGNVSDSAKTVVLRQSETITNVIDVVNNEAHSLSGLHLACHVGTAKGEGFSLRQGSVTSVDGTFTSVVAASSHTIGSFGGASDTAEDTVTCTFLEITGSNFTSDSPTDIVVGDVFTIRVRFVVQGSELTQASSLRVAAKQDALLADGSVAPTDNTAAIQDTVANLASASPSTTVVITTESASLDTLFRFVHTADLITAGATIGCYPSIVNDGTTTSTVSFQPSGQSISLTQSATADLFSVAGSTPGSLASGQSGIVSCRFITVTSAGGLTRDGTAPVQAGDVISFKYVLLGSDGPEVALTGANFSISIKDGVLRKDGSSGSAAPAQAPIATIGDSGAYPDDKRLLLRSGDRLEDKIEFTGVAPTAIYFVCDITSGSTTFSTLPFRLSDPTNGSLSPKVTTDDGLVPSGLASPGDHTLTCTVTSITQNGTTDMNDGSATFTVGSRISFGIWLVKDGVVASDASTMRLEAFSAIMADGRTGDVGSPLQATAGVSNQIVFQQGADITKLLRINAVGGSVTGVDATIACKPVKGTTLSFTLQGGGGAIADGDPVFLPSTGSVVGTISTADHATVGTVECLFTTVTSAGGLSKTSGGTAIEPGDLITFEALFLQSRGTVTTNANWKAITRAVHPGAAVTVTGVGSVDRKNYMSDGSSADGTTAIQNAGAIPAANKVAFVRKDDNILDVIDFVATGSITGVNATVGCLPTEDRGVVFDLTFPSTSNSYTAGNSIFQLRANSSTAYSATVAAGVHEVTCVFTSVTAAGTAPMLRDTGVSIEAGVSFTFNIFVLPSRKALTGSDNITLVATTSALMADGSVGDGTTAISDAEATLAGRSTDDALNLLLLQGESLSTKVKIVAGASSVADTGVVSLTCLDGEAGMSGLTMAQQGSQPYAYASGEDVYAAGGNVGSPSSSGVSALVECVVSEVAETSPSLTFGGSAVEVGDYVGFRATILTITEATTSANFKVVAKTSTMMASGDLGDASTAIHNTSAALASYTPTGGSFDKVLVLTNGNPLSDYIDVVATADVGQTTNITASVVCPPVLGYQARFSVNASASSGGVILSHDTSVPATLNTSDADAGKVANIQCFFLSVTNAGGTALTYDGTNPVLPGSAFSIRAYFVTAGTEVPSLGAYLGVTGKNTTVMENGSNPQDQESIHHTVADLDSQSSPSDRTVVLREGQNVEDALLISNLSGGDIAGPVTALLACRKVNNTLITVQELTNVSNVADGAQLFAMSGVVGTQAGATVGNVTCVFLSVSNLDRESGTPLVAGDTISFRVAWLPPGNEIVGGGFRVVAATSGDAGPFMANGAKSDTSVTLNNTIANLNGLSDNSEKVIILEDGDNLGTSIKIVTTADGVGDGNDIQLGCPAVGGVQVLATTPLSAPSAVGDDMFTIGGLVTRDTGTGSQYVNVECVVTWFSNAGTNPVTATASQALAIGDRISFRAVVLPPGNEVESSSNFRVVAKAGALMADGSAADGVTTIHDVEATVNLLEESSRVLVLRQGESIAQKVSIIATTAIGNTTAFDVSLACKQSDNTLISLTKVDTGSAVTNAKVMSPSGIVGEASGSFGTSGAYLNFECIFLKVANAGTPALSRGFFPVEGGDRFYFRARMFDTGNVVTRASNIKVMAKAGSRMADGSPLAEDLHINDTEGNLNVLASDSGSIISLEVDMDLSTRLKIDSTGSLVDSDVVGAKIGCVQTQGTLVIFTPDFSDPQLFSSSGTVVPPTQNGGLTNVECTFLHLPNTSIKYDGTNDAQEGDRFYFRANFRFQRVATAAANFRIVATQNASMADGSKGDGLTALQDTTTALATAALSKVVVLTEGDDISQMLQIIAAEPIGSQKAVSTALTCTPKQGTTVKFTLANDGVVDVNDVLFEGSGTVSVSGSPEVDTVTIAGAWSVGDTIDLDGSSTVDCLGAGLYTVVAADIDGTDGGAGPATHEAIAAKVSAAAEANGCADLFAATSNGAVVSLAANAGGATLGETFTTTVTRSSVGGVSLLAEVIANAPGVNETDTLTLSGAFRVGDTIQFSNGATNCLGPYVVAAGDVDGADGGGGVATRTAVAASVAAAFNAGACSGDADATAAAAVVSLSAKVAGTAIGVTFGSAAVTQATTASANVVASATPASSGSSGAYENIICTFSDLQTVAGSPAMKLDTSNLVAYDNLIAFRVLFKKRPFEMVAGPSGLFSANGTFINPGTPLGSTGADTVLLFPGQQLPANAIQLKVLSSDGAGGGGAPVVTCRPVTGGYGGALATSLDATVQGISDNDAAGLVSASTLTLPEANSNPSASSIDRISCSVVTAGDSWTTGDSFSFDIRTVDPNSSNATFSVVVSEWGLGRTILGDGKTVHELHAPLTGVSDPGTMLAVPRGLEVDVTVANSLVQLKTVTHPTRGQWARVRCLTQYERERVDSYSAVYEGSNTFSETDGSTQYNTIGLANVLAGLSDRSIPHGTSVVVACVGAGQWEGLTAAFGLVVVDMVSPGLAQGTTGQFEILAGGLARTADGTTFSANTPLGFFEYGATKNVVRLEARTSRHMDAPNGSGTAGAGDFIRLRMNIAGGNTSAVAVQCSAADPVAPIPSFTINVPANAAGGSIVGASLPSSGALVASASEQARGVFSQNFVYSCAPSLGGGANANGVFLADGSQVYTFMLQYTAELQNTLFSVVGLEGERSFSTTTTTFTASSSALGVDVADQALPYFVDETSDTFGVTKKNAVQIVIVGNLPEVTAPATLQVRCSPQGRAKLFMANDSYVTLDANAVVGTKVSMTLPVAKAFSDGGPALLGGASGTTALVTCTLWDGTKELGERSTFQVVIEASNGTVAHTSPDFDFVPGPAATIHGTALEASSFTDSKLGVASGQTLGLRFGQIADAGELAKLKITTAPPAGVSPVVRCESSMESLMRSFSVTVPAGTAANAIIDVQLPRPFMGGSVINEVTEGSYDPVITVDFECYDATTTPVTGWNPTTSQNFRVKINHESNAGSVLQGKQNALFEIRPGTTSPVYNRSYTALAQDKPIGDGPDDAIIFGEDSSHFTAGFLRLVPLAEPAADGTIRCASSHESVLPDVTIAVTAADGLNPVDITMPDTTLVALQVPLEVNFRCEFLNDNPWEGASSTIEAPAVASFTAVFFKQKTNAFFAVVSTGGTGTAKGVLADLAGEQTLGHLTNVLNYEDDLEVDPALAVKVLQQPDADVSLTCAAAGVDGSFVRTATLTIPTNTAAGEVIGWNSSNPGPGPLASDNTSDRNPRYVCYTTGEEATVFAEEAVGRRRMQQVSWAAASAIHTFTLAVRDTSEVNQNFDLVAGASASNGAASIAPGTAIRDGTTSRISVAELATAGAGDLLKVRVKSGSARRRSLLSTALGVRCTSSNKAVMADFETTVATLNFNAQTDVLLPQPVPVFTTTLVQYTCSPFGTDLGEWQPTDVHTFTVEVTNTNSNPHFSIVSRALAVGAQDGLYLDINSPLGEFLQSTGQSDVIRVDEGVPSGLGDIMAVKVLASPTVAWQVDCTSDQPAILADFSVSDTTTSVNFIKGIQFPTAASVTSDTYVNYTCVPAADYPGIGAIWTTESTHKFKVLVRNVNENPNFEFVAASAIPLTAGGNTAIDDVLTDAGGVTVNELAAFNNFGKVRRKAGDDTTFAADMFCASSDTAVHGGFTVSLGAGDDESTAFTLPASLSISGDVTVTFTCKAVTATTNRDWTAAGQTHKFTVTFAAQTTNSNFQIITVGTPVKIGGGNFSAGEVVTVGGDGLQLNEMTDIGNGNRLQVKATTATTGTVIKCKSSHPEVLSFDGLSSELATATSGSISAGSTFEFASALLRSNNVATDITVRVTCGVASAGSWNVADKHVLEILIKANAAAPNSTNGNFTIVAGSHAFSSNADGVLISSDTAVSDTAPFPQMPGGFAWDSTTQYSLVRVKVQVGVTSGSYLVRCASSNPDIVPTFTSTAIDAAASYGEIQIPPGIGPFSADVTVNFECTVVLQADGSTAVGAGTGWGTTDVHTFSIEVRKQKFQVLAGMWAFDAFTGRKMIAKGQELSLLSDKSRVVLTAQSSLGAGDLAYIRALGGTLANSTATVQVACNTNPSNTAGGDAEIGNFADLAVPEYTEALSIPSPLLIASDADVTVTCVALQSSGSVVAEIDKIQFGIRKRSTRFSVIGQAASINGTTGNTASGAVLSPYEDASTVDVAVAERVSYDAADVAYIKHSTAPSAGRTYPIKCEALSVAGDIVSSTLIPRLWADSDLTELNYDSGTPSLGLFVPASLDVSVDKGVRVSCHVDEDFHPDPSRLLATGAAAADEWVAADRAVFVLNIRTNRFKYVAGTYAYRTDGTQITAGTSDLNIVAFPNDKPTIAALSDTGAGDILRIKAQTLYTLPANLGLTCTSSDGVQFGGATPFYVPCNGAGCNLSVTADATNGDYANLDLPAVTAGVGVDTDIVVTCRPTGNTGSNQTDFWVIDSVDVTLSLREQRLIAVPGSRAVRDSDATLMSQGALGQIGYDYDDAARTVQISHLIDTDAGEVFRVQAASTGPTADVPIECGGDFFAWTATGTIASDSTAALDVDLPASIGDLNVAAGRVQTLIHCKPTAAAGGWIPADRVTVAVSLRQPRFKIVAGSFAYAADTGNKINENAHLSSLAQSLTPTIAIGKTYGTAGIASLRAFNTAVNGDAYTSNPTAQVQVQCKTSNTAVLADPGLVTVASNGGTTSVGIAVEGSTGAQAVTADTFVKVTCHPTSNTATTNSREFWTIGDAAQFMVQVRKPRLVPFAGPESKRATNTTNMTTNTTVIDRFRTDPDALLITENKTLASGDVLRLKLAEDTANGFAVSVICSSSSPAILPGTAAFDVNFSSQIYTNVDVGDTSAVSSDQFITYECAPNPGAILSGSGLFMTDIAIMEVTVKNNLPPTTGLVNDTYDVAPFDEDGEGFVLDIRTITNVALGKDLDGDGNDVTFAIVCDPSLGTAEFTDAANGIVQYTPRADANGQDYIVFDVTDTLGAKSNFGIINVTILRVPDAPVANVVTIATIDGTLGRRSYSWVDNGLISDPDGIDTEDDEDAGNGVQAHYVEITKLPNIGSDLIVSASDVLTWQTEALTVCTPPVTGPNPCFPRRVKVTKFEYETALNSATAYDGTDEIKYQVFDGTGRQSVEGTLILTVNRQGDNNVPPITCIDPPNCNIADGLTFLEDQPASAQPAMFPTGQKDDGATIQPEQLLYPVTAVPSNGTVEIWCPEPLSYQEQNVPLVVTAPNTCPTPGRLVQTAGNPPTRLASTRTNRPIKLVLADGSPDLTAAGEQRTTCDPACIADAENDAVNTSALSLEAYVDANCPNSCLRAEGVLNKFQVVASCRQTNGNAVDTAGLASCVYLQNAGEPSQLPSFRYTPNANFFGTDTFVYRARDTFSDSAAAYVTVAVSNAVDPPTPMCADDSTVFSRGLTTRLIAEDMRLGPQGRNWHPGPYTDVSTGDTVTASPPGSGSCFALNGISAYAHPVTCDRLVQPDFKDDPASYPDFAVTTNNNLRTRLFPDTNEPPMTKAVQAIVSLAGGDVFFNEQKGIELVCGGLVRSVRAAMTEDPSKAAGFDDGTRFALSINYPDYDPNENPKYRYMIRELEVDRADPYSGLSATQGPLAGAVYKAVSSGMRVTPPSTPSSNADLTVNIEGAQVTTASIYAQGVESTAGLAMDQFQQVGHIPMFLDYKPPNGQAGNILSRWAWGYSDVQDASFADFSGSGEQYEKFTALGVVEFHVGCSPGTKSSKPDTVGPATTWTCEPCPAGYFNSPGIYDQKTCEPCPAGSSSVPGSTSCTICPQGSYAGAAGSPECSQCPDARMTTADVGAQAVTDCLCPVGTFRPRKGTELEANGLSTDSCFECGGNTVCTLENQPIPLPAQEGFTVDPRTGNVFECVVGEACPRLTSFEQVESGVCGVGYARDPGAPCNNCAEKYYKSGLICKKCRNDTAVYVVFGVIILIALAPLLMKLAQKNVFASVNILIVFFQTTIVFAELKWAWPQELLDMFAYFSIFSLNIELVSPECFVGDFSSLHKIWISNLMPLILGVLLLGLYHLQHFLTVRRARLTSFPCFVTLDTEQMVKGRVAVSFQPDRVVLHRLTLWENLLGRKPAGAPLQEIDGSSLKFSFPGCQLTVEGVLIVTTESSEADGISSDLPRQLNLETAYAREIWIGLQMLSDEVPEDAMGPLAAIGAMDAGRVARGILIDEGDRRQAERVRNMGKHSSVRQGIFGGIVNALSTKTPAHAVAAPRAVASVKAGRGAAAKRNRAASQQAGAYDGIDMRAEANVVSDPRKDDLRQAIYQEFGSGVHPKNAEVLAERLIGENHDRYKAESAVRMVLLLMYFVLLQANSVYFDCRLFNGELRWFKEPSNKCYETPLHVALLPVVIIAIIVYGFGIPYYFWKFLYKNVDIISRRDEIVERLSRYQEDAQPGSTGKRESDGASFALRDADAIKERDVVADWEKQIDDARRLFIMYEQIGFIFKRYESQVWWYELVVISRKALLVGFSMIQRQMEQILCIVLLLVMSSCVLLRHGPYEDDHLDVMESFALMVNIIITICGATFYLDIFTDKIKVNVGYAAFGVLAVSSAILIGFVLFDAVPKVRMLMRFSRQGKSVRRLEAGRHQSLMEAAMGQIQLKEVGRRIWCFFVGGHGKTSESRKLSLIHKKVEKARKRHRWVLLLAIRCFVVPPRKRIMLRVAREVMGGFDDFKNGKDSDRGYAQFRRFVLSLRDDRDMETVAQAMLTLHRCHMQGKERAAMRLARILDMGATDALLVARALEGERPDHAAGVAFLIREAHNDLVGAIHKLENPESDDAQKKIMSREEKKLEQKRLNEITFSEDAAKEHEKVYSEAAVRLSQSRASWFFRAPSDFDKTFKGLPPHLSNDVCNALEFIAFSPVIAQNAAESAMFQKRKAATAKREFDRARVVLNRVSTVASPASQARVGRAPRTPLQPPLLPRPLAPAPAVVTPPPTPPVPRSF